jgi:hypothetical protein
LIDLMDIVKTVRNTFQGSVLNFFKNITTNKT